MILLKVKIWLFQTPNQKPSFHRTVKFNSSDKMILFQPSLSLWKIKSKGIPIMLLLLLSRFSRVQLCASPCTAAYQASPSMGFSRQEHWSGLPFPSPMHVSGKWKLKVKSLSRVRLLATSWTVAHQAPPSMGFSRQEYWSGVPMPSPYQLWEWLK